jgi:hypothetical protein
MKRSVNNPQPITVLKKNYPQSITLIPENYPQSITFFNTFNPHFNL